MNPKDCFAGCHCEAEGRGSRNDEPICPTGTSFGLAVTRLGWPFQQAPPPGSEVYYLAP